MNNQTQQRDKEMRTHLHDNCHSFKRTKTQLVGRARTESAVKMALYSK